MPGETATLPVHSIHAVDASGRLADDVACVQCGYNLRGALGPPAGRCPECGLPVGRSTMGHWLRFAEPEWLRTVWGGLNRLAVLIVCSALLAIVPFTPLWDLRLQWPDEVVMFLPTALIATGVVVGLHGLWKATTPEPVRISARRITARRLTRLFVPAVAITAVVAAVDFLSMSNFAAERSWLQALPYLVLVAMIASLLEYARGLAKRVPRPWLARVTWSMVVVLVLTGVTFVAVMEDWGRWMGHVGRLYNQAVWGSPYARPLFNSWNNPYEWFDLAYRVSGSVLLATVVLGIPGLFVWYWVVLTGEARRARETWAKRPWAGKAGDAAGEANGR